MYRPRAGRGSVDIPATRSRPRVSRRAVRGFAKLPIPPDLAEPPFACKQPPTGLRSSAGDDSICWRALARECNRSSVSSCRFSASSSRASPLGAVASILLWTRPRSFARHSRPPTGFDPASRPWRTSSVDERFRHEVPGSPAAPPGRREFWGALGEAIACKASSHKIIETGNWELGTEPESRNPSPPANGCQPATRSSAAWSSR